MKWSKQASILDKWLIFNKETLRFLEPKEENLNANLQNWIKNKKIIPLKKGVYLSKNRFEAELEKDLYLEYIANKLIQPSYLSLEYVLAKYQILSEPVFALTSITSKAPREINNSLASFRYYSISERLFLGFNLKKFKDTYIFLASKEKALFDYLYLRFLKERKINIETINNLRINWELISKKDFQKAEYYTKLTKRKRIKKVFTIIKKNYYA